MEQEPPPISNEAEFNAASEAAAAQVAEEQAGKDPEQVEVEAWNGGEEVPELPEWEPSGPLVPDEPGE